MAKQEVTYNGTKDMEEKKQRNEKVGEMRAQVS